MTEAWEGLAASRGAQKQCAEDVDKLKKEHAEAHPGSKHIMESREDYGKLIDRIRSRYLESKEQEWFSGRQDFLKELDGMLSEARAYKVELAAIDARIAKEKRKWYLENLGSLPGVQKALGDLLEKREVLDKAVDADVKFEELVGAVRIALKSGGAESLDADKILDRLTAMQTPEERLQTFKEAFFQDTPDEPLSGKRQKYMDRLHAGSSMEVIARAIMADRRSSLSELDQKEKHRKRIDELRRARTAHELQKARKKSGRQGSVALGPTPADSLYNLPPCEVCGKVPDAKDYMPCALCQVLVDGAVRPRAVVFCSPACTDKGYDTHLEQSHRCASADKCVQVTDEDVDMDTDGSGPFLCRECTISLKTESVFCSPRCADANFQRHREGVHIPRREERHLETRDEDELSYEQPDKSRYHAKDIASRLIPLETALKEFQQKNGAESLPLDQVP